MALLNYRVYLAAMSALSSVGVVPAAILLAFGERPNQPVVEPTAAFVSSVPSCVMFCEAVTLMSPTTTPQPTPSPTPATPGCWMLCDEPPLPSGEELCELFCDLGLGR